MNRPFQLCIVGDSHVAAIKQGWDQIEANWPDVNVRFLAKAANSLSGLVARGTRITLRGAGEKQLLEKTFGYSAIDVAEIDSFLCAGMMPSIHALVQMQTTHKLACQAHPAEQYVSEAAYAAAYQDMFRDSLLAKVLDVLRQAGARHGFVTLEPCRSSRLLEKQDHPIAGVYHELLSAGEGPVLADLLERTVSRLLPEGFSYLPPPADLTEQRLMTRREFSVGSTRLLTGQEHSENDNKHMNGAYGAALLQAALHRLGQRPATLDRQGTGA